jgi:protein-S-isoprenylcysteine O-methyltransferase Ste14
MKIIIFLSFAFGLSELALVLFKHSRSGNVKTRKDKGSLILLWSIITFSLTAGFFLANYDPWRSINYLLASLGIVLYVSGLLIRWISIIKLKQRFTVNVTVIREHKLETEGLYRYLRHPSYLGLILIMAGLALGMNSFISFIIVVAPIFLGLQYRISVEEKLLESEFGDEYTQFKSTRKRIIPFLF